MSYNEMLLTWSLRLFQSMVATEIPEKKEIKTIDSEQGEVVCLDATVTGYV